MRNFSKTILFVLMVLSDICVTPLHLTYSIDFVCLLGVSLCFSYMFLNFAHCHLDCVLLTFLFQIMIITLSSAVVLQKNLRNPVELQMLRTTVAFQAFQYHNNKSLNISCPTP